MKRKSFERMDCSVARTLEVVGEWWSLLIVRDSLSGVRRFEEFQSRLGIARNVLATRLAKLVRQGVLERRPYREHPPRFEYVLTEKGRELSAVVIALMTWGDRWASRRAPPVEIYFQDTGEAVDPVLVDGRTGRRLDPRVIRSRPGPGASKEVRAFYARHGVESARPRGTRARRDRRG
jgi:DNA-binding HxlR family transcriptional regulator